MSYIIRS